MAQSRIGAVGAQFELDNQVYRVEGHEATRDIYQCINEATGTQVEVAWETVDDEGTWINI